MSHNRFEELLARRSELTPAEEQQLQEHLRGCPQCRTTAAAYEQQTHLLRSLPPVNPPPSLRAGVLAGIRQPQPRRRWWSPRPVALLGPAAAAALLVVAALAFHNLHTNESPGNTAAGPAPTATFSHRPAFGPSAADSKASSKTSSQPKRRSGAPPPAHHAQSKPSAPGAVLTSPPIQSLPGAAPAPTAPAPNAVFRPAAPSPVPQAHNARAATSQSPVNVAGGHPAPPTAQPAPRPPVVVAPMRTPVPAPTPIQFTPMPVTGITITASGASPVSTETPTPTPTANS